MWRGLLVIAAAQLLGLTTKAAAQGPVALEGVLQVHGDAGGCVTEPALRARVRRWLKPQAVVTSVTVEVDARATPPSFRVRRGTDTLAARSFDVLPAACGDRLDAIALAVALAIEHAFEPESDAGAAAAPEEAAPTPAANADETAPSPPAPSDPRAEAAKPVAATPAKPPAAEAVARSTPAPPREAHARSAAWDVYAGAGLWFEVLPEAVPALAVGADVRLSGPLRLDAALLGSAQTSGALDQWTIHAQLAGARALACLSAPLEPFAVAGCAGLGGGVAFASGNGPNRQNRNAVAAWLAPIARGYLRFPAAGALSVRAGAGAVFNVVRPRLVVDDTPRAAKAAGVVGAEASLELLIALP